MVYAAHFCDSHYISIGQCCSRLSVRSSKGQKAQKICIKQKWYVFNLLPSWCYSKAFSLERTHIKHKVKQDNKVMPCLGSVKNDVLNTHRQALFQELGIHQWLEQRPLPSWSLHQSKWGQIHMDMGLFFLLFEHITIF